MRHHVLRNALNPVVTAASGWLAQLLAGAVFVEFVFGWRGLGFLLFEALEQQDLPVVMGGVLVVSFTFVAVNASGRLDLSAFGPEGHSGLKLCSGPHIQSPHQFLDGSVEVPFGPVAAHPLQPLNGIGQKHFIGDEHVLRRQVAFIHLHAKL